MRKHLRAIISALVLCADVTLSSAGIFSTTPVTPDKDSLSVMALRAHLDSVRLREGRPTVAVVLSGGGAKGAAHVGVLRRLEELGIPVDFIAGTSMGGLVGGIYALGYKAPYLDSLLRSIDWNTALSDRIPDNYVPYREKRAREKYIIQVPFSFGSDNDALAARDDRRRVLRNSLPSGYAYGLNVGTIISSLTVGYQDPVDFLSLPIPFCAVASDLVSTRAKYWFDGSLPLALRSTMSIPVLFSPVRTDGMVLVDGGMRNNFPTDVARAAGADYIIGVGLGDGDPTYDDIRSLPDLISPIIDLSSRETLQRNIELADVFIKPDMGGYNMLSFGDEEIADIIGRGYDAALSAEDELRTIAKVVSADHGSPGHVRPATDINVTPVLVSAIRFTGLAASEEEMLLSRIKIRPGSKVGRKAVDAAVASIFSTGALRSVTYEMSGETEPYTLIFHCIKSPSNNLSLGLRADNEEMVDMLFNLGVGTNSLYGSQFEFTTRLGQNLQVSAHYIYNRPGIPTLNAELRLRDSEAHFHYGEKKRMPLSFRQFSEILYFSNLRLRRYDGNLGLRNDYTRLSDWSYPAGGGLSRTDNFRQDNLSLFANASFNDLDDAYFPTRGMSVGAGGNWMFLRNGSEGRGQAFRADFAFRTVFRLGPSLAALLHYNAGAVFNMGADLSQQTLLGGALAGRLSEYHVPFCGLVEPVATGPFMDAGQAALRYNPVDSHFLTVTAGYFRSDADFDAWLTDIPVYWGLSLGYGYNSFLGPVKAELRWSNYTHRAGLYLSFGYDF